MVPLKYEDSRKRTEAMTAAFIERFMIGFLIPDVYLGIDPTTTGVYEPKKCEFFLHLLNVIFILYPCFFFSYNR
jgi:hypothetical protein